MGNTASADVKEEEPPMSPQGKDWRAIMIDDLGLTMDDVQNDEMLDSEEEEEFFTLLKKYELLYTLAELESERPMKLFGEIDEGTRTEVERRTMQSLESVKARAQAKLGGQTSQVNTKPLAMESVYNGGATTNPTQAQAAAATPDSTPLSSAIKGSRGGKKQLASLRKRVVELQLATGTKQGDSVDPTARTLNFDMGSPAPTRDQAEQEEIIRGVSSMALEAADEHRPPHDYDYAPQSTSDYSATLYPQLSSSNAPPLSFSTPVYPALANPQNSSCGAVVSEAEVPDMSFVAAEGMAEPRSVADTPVPEAQAQSLYANVAIAEPQASSASTAADIVSEAPAQFTTAEQGAFDLRSGPTDERAMPIEDYAEETEFMEDGGAKCETTPPSKDRTNQGLGSAVMENSPQTPIRQDEAIGAGVKELTGSDEVPSRHSNLSGPNVSSSGMMTRSAAKRAQNRSLQH